MAKVAKARNDYIKYQVYFSIIYFAAFFNYRISYVVYLN